MSLAWTWTQSYQPFHAPAWNLADFHGLARWRWWFVKDSTIQDNENLYDPLNTNTTTLEEPKVLQKYKALHFLHAEQMVKASDFHFQL